MGKIEKISSILKDGLAELSMFTKDVASEGLKFVSDKETELNPYIKLHLYDAEKYNAQAVYFRYFENKPPIPQIYIYEESNLQNTTDELHKELWSSCRVPIFFVITQTQIKIFNSLSKEPDIKEIEPLKVIDIISKASAIKKIFSAKMFDSGDFWNTKFAQESFSYATSAYETLLNYLRIARADLVNKSSLPEQIINGLIIKSILIRYLEERGVFDSNYWGKFSEKANSFIDVCEDKTNNQHSALIKLFEDLSNHFNGGIFKLSDNEKDQILTSDLSQFIFFLRGDININTLQKHFWSFYSFKDLPIELISNIYELFLENEKGIVYTPSLLVNFMIDEIMPLETPQNDYKVLDPACGSGVFLVGAFKRHIQWWMIRNKFKKPDIKTLKDIIKNNIFGIDEKKEAVELAKFSLSLALCDVLSPEVIWEKLHFDDLSKSGNLITKDFFEILSDKSYHNIFDLVIGNPPFVSELTTKAARKIDEQSLINNPNRPKLPDKQLAFLFLEQSFKLCKKGQYVCMIQPSSFLYANITQNFRNYLFSNFHFRQIIDFAGLNTTLFKRSGSGADVAVSVSFIKNEKPIIDEENLLHITVRQTFESKEKIYIDLSYYDFHWITYEEALNNKFIWKCNLLGGGRVVDIVKKLSSFSTLGEYLKKMKEVSDWSYGEGYQEGREDKKNKIANFITGKMTLPPEAFTVNGIDNSKLYIVKDVKFQWTREGNESIFKAPHVLIKKQISNTSILSEFRDDDLTFKNTIFGIHTPINHREKLIELDNYFKMNSMSLLFFLVTTSSRALIYKATSLLQKDLLSLPYKKNIRISKVENYFIEDTLNHMVEWVKGTKSSLKVFEEVSQEQLQKYQEIYCSTLNTIYKHFKLLNILQTEQFIICSFYYKTKPESFLKDSDSLDNELENLIYEKTRESTIIKKLFKIYDKNLVYIIKPKQYRYWMNSIAVKDADDSFSDLIEMRY